MMAWEDGYWNQEITMVATMETDDDAAQWVCNTRIKCLQTKCLAVGLKYRETRVN